MAWLPLLVCTVMLLASFFPAEGYLSSEVYIKVDRDFLSVNCQGHYRLQRNVPTSNRGQEYKFIVSFMAEAEHYDDVDDIVYIHVQADRCGKAYYLSAQQIPNTQPSGYRVVFQRSPGTESRWVRESVPGGTWQFRSWWYADLAVANDGQGKLVLQTLSKDTRATQLTLDPVRPRRKGR